MGSSTGQLAIVVFSNHPTPQLVRLLTVASLSEDNKASRHRFGPELCILSLSSVCTSTHTHTTNHITQSLHCITAKGAKKAECFETDLEHEGTSSKQTRRLQTLEYIWKVLSGIIAFSGLKFPIICKQGSKKNPGHCSRCGRTAREGDRVGWCSWPRL